MATRSTDAYTKSLQDGRTVYYKGERVADVTTHPILKTAVEHAALEYELTEDPAHREVLTYTLPGSPECFSRYFKIPENAEDLLRRREIIELGTRAGWDLLPHHQGDRQRLSVRLERHQPAYRCQVWHQLPRARHALLRALPQS